MLRMIKLGFAVWIIWTTCLAASALGQSCGLDPEGGPLGYQRRYNGSRCEGFIRQPVAGTAGVVLVSLTYGAVAFDWAHNAELQLGLSQKPKARVRIRGEFIPFTRYYRLDAEIGPEQPMLRVGLSDVIARAEMTPEQLGLYAYRLLPGGVQEVIPIAVTADAPPRVSTGVAIHAILRAGIDVTDLRWRLRAGDLANAYRPAPTGFKVLPAGASVSLDFEPPSSPRATLDLLFLDSSGRELSNSIRIASN